MTEFKNEEKQKKVNSINYALKIELLTCNLQKR